MRSYKFIIQYIIQYKKHNTNIQIVMEKYRRWTDQATGINPFIAPKMKPIRITTVLLSAIIAVLKLHVVMLFFLPIIFSLLLEKYVKNIPIISILNKLPIKILSIMLGLTSVDDSNFKKWVQKNNNNANLILSNSVCILDAFYYMANLKSVKFIVSTPQQDKFQSVGGLSAILSVLSSKQPFFTMEPSTNSLPFKTLIQKQLKQGNNCIVFYEGIRTNGLGTIKISTKLSNQLYNLQKNYCISHLKYISAPEGLFSTVSMPLILFFTALGECSIQLKVRSNPIAISSQHSGADIQKDIDTFLMANASKLLDTNPASYFEFLDFYNKTQNGDYKQLPNQQNMKKQ